MPEQGMDVINACSQILDWSSFQFSEFSNMTIAVASTSNFFLPFHVPFCLTHRNKNVSWLSLKKREQEVFLCDLSCHCDQKNVSSQSLTCLRLRYRFRRGFKQFFRCCPFVHVGPEVLTRREAVTSRYSCTGSPDHHRIVRNGKSTSKRSFNFTTEA